METILWSLITGMTSQDSVVDGWLVWAMVIKEFNIGLQRFKEGGFKLIV